MIFNSNYTSTSSSAIEIEQIHPHGLDSLHDKSGHLLLKETGL